ncbi:MAG: NUDIX hydrolase [Acidobacteriota bacterium]
MEIEHRLEGERVYSGRIVRLDVDRVRLGNGVETIREVVRHPGASLVVPLLDDGRVVLVRQYRYAVAEMLLELPAGKLDAAGEEPLACAQRELAEETGYAALTWIPLGDFYTTPGFTDEKIHCFLAAGLLPAQGRSADEDESIEVVPVAMTEAVELVRRGAIRDAKTIAALLLAQLSPAFGAGQ